ncbi:MAG: O-antigen ligase family protein [Candidatus Scalindua sp. AMX11]|nr:MAG: O-antigen ligase family protein [Candidatus Scalindua sp.]NOG82984.1 O-antigen ligase family protein [Planctomycetota bacterium]RZV68042.1 MAG: O-antigen ligase family protein [Candidatus Scalindua sp. SCAELEC01]TDE63733.1 MAG: O-antigen ligase family protein [Candidatus Scalindua sp. AMX11]
MTEQISKIPWLIFIFLSILFFFIEGHELTFSLHVNQDISTDDLITMASGEGSPLRRISLALLAISSSLIFLLKGLQKIEISGILGWSMLLFILWCLTSIAWSTDAPLTLRRLIVLLAISVSGFFLSQQYPVKNLVFFVLVSCGLYLITGISCEIYMGTFTPFAADYRFSGTHNANMQGANCALLLIAAASFFFTRSNNRYYYILIMVFALLALFLTKSRTSFYCSILAVLIIYIVSSPLNLKKLISLFAFFAILLGFVVIITNSSSISMSDTFTALNLGRGTENVETYTGRTFIWKMCLNYIAERPYCGYGFNCFWNATHIYELISTLNWPVNSAHSLYLNLMLSVGLVGAIIFVVFLVWGIRNTFVLFMRTGESGYLFLFSLFVFFTIHGIFEGYLIELGYIPFVFFWGLCYCGFRRKSAVEQTPKMN